MQGTVYCNSYFPFEWIFFSKLHKVMIHECTAANTIDFSTQLINN